MMKTPVRSPAAALAAAFALAGCATAPGDASSGRGAGTGLGGAVDVVEATVADLRAAQDAGRVSAEGLVALHLARIDAYDRAGPALRAVLRANPRAAAEAQALDAAPRPVGPLHGIPVLVKDNIDVAGLPTSAGALALAGNLPPGDATVVARLRAAGAVVLGKGQLTELANHVSGAMPAGYSALGGQALDPYDPRPLPGGDGRPVLSPGGSSTGPAVAVSASLAVLALGTETSGSILSPAAANGVVGIKPTTGLASRAGIVPLSLDQDTPGPIARTVADAALLLGVIAGHDPADPATAACLVPGRCHADYARFLDAGALRGARLLLAPYPPSRVGAMEAAVAALEGAGATVHRLAAPLPPVGVPGTLGYAFKRDFGAWLARLPASAPVHSLAGLIAYNEATPGAARYGQETLVAAEALSLDPAGADTARYLADREAGRDAARRILGAALDGPDGVAGTPDDHDALLFHGSGGAGMPARAGWPSVVVPAGYAAPEPPVEGPVPVGLAFTGRAWSEPRLIALAHAFERATRLRRAPAATPPLPGAGAAPAPTR